MYFGNATISIWRGVFIYKIYISLHLVGVHGVTFKEWSTLHFFFFMLLFLDIFNKFSSPKSSSQVNPYSKPLIVFAACIHMVHCFSSVSTSMTFAVWLGFIAFGLNMWNFNAFLLGLPLIIISLYTYFQVVLSSISSEFLMKFARILCFFWLFSFSSEIWYSHSTFSCGNLSEFMPHFPQRK